MATIPTVQGADPPAGERRTGKKTQRGWRVVAYVIAIALLIASIWFAFREQRAEPWEALLSADAFYLAGLVVAILFSALLITSFVFWLVTVPFVTTQSLGLGKMFMLVSASVLLNYTPVKAGLIGRVGYLRYAHGVGYAAAVISNLLIGALFGAAAVVTVAATLWQPGFGIAWFVATGTGLVISAGALVVLFRLLQPRDVPINGPLAGNWYQAGGFMLIGLVAQVLVLYTTALRWWFVFRILGVTIELPNAWILSLVHTLSIALGPANGLGLREWLVGISGGLLGTELSAGYDLTAGLSASLVDRSAEGALVVLLGTASIFALRRFSRREPDNGSGDQV